MNLNAISSINFKNNYRSQEPFETNFVDCDECDGFEKHIEDVKKVKSNVNPLTCIVGIAAGALALKKGSKIVGYARSAVAKGAEEVTKFTVNVASKVKKSINAEDVNTRVSNFFAKAQNKADDINVNKFGGVKTKIVDIVDSIFGKAPNAEGATKGDRFVKKLNDNGIFLNGKSLFDNTIAGVAAYGAMDLVSDKTEQTIDDGKIKKSAMDNLGFYSKVATDLVTDLVE